LKNSWDTQNQWWDSTQVDDDCCALPESAKCEFGYRYSKGKMCASFWACEAFETCCERCENPFEDCESENDAYGGDVDCVGTVGVIIIVIICLVVLCSVLACVYCCVRRCRRDQNRAPYATAAGSEIQMAHTGLQVAPVVFGTIVAPAGVAAPAEGLPKGRVSII
jgi:hypothetical protein